MASQSLRLAINADKKHVPALNNLGALEMKNGNVNSARTYFHAAASIANYSYEPHFNSALLAYNVSFDSLIMDNEKYYNSLIFNASIF